MPRTLAGAKAPRRCIGFRLDQENHRALVERAAKFKVSPHDLARSYVIQVLQEQEERVALHAAIDALHRDTIAGLREGIAGLLRQGVQLRNDLLVAVEALLESAGQVDRAEAHTWVKENFP